MANEERELYVCNDLPIIVMTIKTQNKGWIEIYLDTVSYFKATVTNHVQTVIFKINELHPEEYSFIVENNIKIEEVYLKVSYLFQDEITSKIKYKTIFYNPFNTISVTKELNSSNDKIPYEFYLTNIQ